MSDSCLHLSERSVSVCTQNKKIKKQSSVKLERRSHIRTVAMTTDKTAGDYFLSATEMRYTKFGGDNDFVLKGSLLFTYYS